ncbi:hypothetical protein [Streptomyces sp. NPDC018693]
MKSAGTSSATVDYNTYDMDLAEGTKLVIELFDDSGLTDKFATVNSAVA